MKVSIEILYHLRCDHCGAWWSGADRRPPSTVHCPECGHENTVEGFQNGKGEDVAMVSWIRPPKERPPIVLDE